MKRLFLDFETYYERPSGYSLRNQKLSMSDYIRHELFQTMGLSYWFEGSEEETQFIRGGSEAIWLHGLDWDSIELVAHNALFEALVLWEIYGLVPARYFCTMAAAEAQLQGTRNSALDDLAKFFNFGSKLPTLKLFQGKRREDLTEEEWEILGEYANNDVDLTVALYGKVETLPEEERQLMDITLRMFGNPLLHVDVPLAREALSEAVSFQEEAIARTGLSKSVISGNISFAELFEDTVNKDKKKEEETRLPFKTSPRTKERVPALAKTDAEFLKFRHSDDDFVRSLVEARLAVKSTQPITRAQRLIDVGTSGTQLLPVCLHYGRAHTLRWTAGNKMNLQNLKRGSKLRRAIVAPPGYVIVVVDSAQIEARILAWLANELQLLEAFRDPTRDPYAEQAEEVYERTITKEKDPIERFVGKVCVLGLGYGMGVDKLWLALLSGAMGGEPMDVDRQFAKDAVDAYRKSRQGIVGFWSDAENLFRALIPRSTETVSLRDGLLVSNQDEQRIDMPNMYLRYFGANETHNMNLYYTPMKGKNVVRTYVWGGTVTENIVQKLARDVIGHQMIEIDKQYPCVLMSHDEVGYLAKENEADEALEYGLQQLRVTPDWAEGLPLDAEGGYDRCYSK